MVHDLSISVDCGITIYWEIAFAVIGCIDVIVTDHHEPKDTVPAGIAILNPKAPGSAYPDKWLAGVGVVLELCQALRREFTRLRVPVAVRILTGALGPAADIVPLTGENRVIARMGSNMLPNSSHIGFRELIDQQGLAGKMLSTSQAVFQLAPCINAVGRLR